MTEPTDELVLRAIAEKSGQLDWYRLDRKLSLQGCVLGGELIEVIQRLQGRGFIALEPSDTPSMPKYVLTEMGWEHLARRR
jgi:hypothetical protein